MGQPDVAALLASMTLAQFLAWMAYYSVDPWDLPTVALSGFLRRKTGTETPQELEARIDRAFGGR